MLFYYIVGRVPVIFLGKKILKTERVIKKNLKGSFFFYKSFNINITTMNGLRIYYSYNFEDNIYKMIYYSLLQRQRRLRGQQISKQRTFRDQ